MNDVFEACEVAGGSDDAAGSDQADGSEPLDSSIRKLAQLIVKDRETGCEYMIADFGDTQNSSQRLVNLSTNETRVFQYNTIEEQGIHGTESLASMSTSASLSHSHAEAASDKKKMGAGKIWSALRRKTARGLASRRRSKADPSGPDAASDIPAPPSVISTLPVDAQSDASSVSSPSGSAASETSTGTPVSRPSLSTQLASAQPLADDCVAVVSHRKVFREFTQLRLVQRWQAHSGVIWRLAFSATGAHLASAGRDRVIRIWENRRAPVDTTGGAAAVRGDEAAAEPFQTPAAKELRGHQDDIFDLSWSGNLFLLSASRDKTVVLWHLYSDAALKTFRHDDCVMAVAFHPVDSRHFVSCSWNGKVRLQCASPARVVDWKQVQLHEALPIHCVRFNSRGSCVTVGALQGRVRHFKVPPSLKLEYHAEIDVREKSARRRDVPVTGLDTLPQRPDALLVTTRDSRVRLYQGPLRVAKYKGVRNRCSRIAASFSPCGTYVICGSDDGSVVIWRTDTEAAVCLPRARGCFTPSPGRLKSDSFEAFRATPCMATVAAFAPVVPDTSAPPPVPFHSPPDVPASAEGAAQAAGSSEVAAVSPKSSAAIKELLKSLRLDPRAGYRDAVASARAEACKLTAYGQCIIVAGIDGSIQLFENTGAPRWL